MAKIKVLSDMATIDGDVSGDEVRSVIRPLVAIEYDVNYIIHSDGIVIESDTQTIEQIRNDDRFTEVS